VKYSIYLPDDLAEQVKQLPDDVNVSAICQHALRRELARQQARREATSDLERVAARLKATIEDKENMEQERGAADGREWAREFATVEELEWITEEFYPGSGGDFGGDSTIRDFVSAQEHQTVISVGHEDTAYWHGFISGAREVFDAVRPLL
jgi:post-segregation antitoxin (ccd killing protein)